MDRTRAWRRFATLHATKRRGAELPPPDRQADTPLPLPPLESPDDDREFLPAPPPPTGLRPENA
jgi:hypothetical protein